MPLTKCFSAFIFFIVACQLDLVVDPVGDTTSPIIENQTLRVNENVATNTFVGTAFATDDGNIASYRITGAGRAGDVKAFAIDKMRGVITTATNMDYETRNNYVLIVEVADEAGNTADALITIEVNDLDEIPPSITNQTFSIADNVSINTEVGLVKATDNVGITSYSITAGNIDNAFALANNGILLTAGAINFETRLNYQLTVEVADNAGNTSNAIITINVILVDKVAPTITNQSFTIGDDASVGSLAGKVTASDNRGVTAYAITAGDDASVFAISNTGELTTAKNLDAGVNNGIYSLTVEVADAARNKATATITVTVADATEPNISNHTFTIADNVAVGSLVGKVSASDNVGVTAYAITAGDDTSVFAISNTGELTTTKDLNAADGNYSLTVEVADAAENKKTATITINVVLPDSDRDGVLDTLDVDDDNDGLIEIYTLEMLDHVRYDLAGTSYRTNANALSNTNGAPATGLRGYELMSNLDFAQASSYSSGRINTAWRPNNANPYDANNAGFTPIGTNWRVPFTAIFEGNNNHINHLYIRTNNSVGLFGYASNSHIRNIGLTNNSVYVEDGNYESVGGLVGRNYGTVSSSYATGNADGGSKNYTTGDLSKYNSVGGLVGWNRGTVSSSYATGGVRGGFAGSGRVGGLVGYNNYGTVSNSYATGNAGGERNGGDNVGGLVGYNNYGTVSNSYATGNADGGDGSDLVGGLVGYNYRGTVSSSYATGNAKSRSGNSDIVGGLVGYNHYSAVISSYATGNAYGGNAIFVGYDWGYKYVGGLVGYNNGRVISSYATGNAYGNDRSRNAVGVLVGYHRGNRVSNSYATGNCNNGNGYYVDGLVGSWFGGIVTNSYYSTNVSIMGGTINTTRGGVSLNTLRANTNNTTRASTPFYRWNTSIWHFGTTSQLPALRRTPGTLAEQWRRHP